jgi:uncharacterized membrane protein (UPF0136 family)
MDFSWDTPTGINLILSAAIMALGLVGYGLAKKTASLYVGLAFGLFGFSHLATLLGQKESWENELIAVRTLAYLLMAFALYKLVFGGRKGSA